MAPLHAKHSRTEGLSTKTAPCPGTQNGGPATRSRKTPRGSPGLSPPGPYTQEIIRASAGANAYQAASILRAAGALRSTDLLVTYPDRPHEWPICFDPTFQCVCLPANLSSITTHGLLAHLESVENGKIAKHL